MGKDYQAFLDSKQIRRQSHGFEPNYPPDWLKPFQRHLVEWAVRLGRSALFEDCGLGKGPQTLVVCENVLRHIGRVNGKALIVCPLAVAEQFEREAKKFGMKATKTQDGTAHRGINVTNYHRLHHFNPSDFSIIANDESQILKNMEGKYRKEITDFMAKVPYRLLATATPAPNDFMELGTSSEALEVMPRNQMLAMFFTNGGETTQQWELKGHAKTRFWQWVSTWARAVRMPSDLGYSDEEYILPKLTVHKNILPSKGKLGFFTKVAKTLEEQRHVQSKTVRERCEKVAELVPKDRPALIWCNRNSEGDLLEKLIPDAVQVAGSDPDDVKERRLNDFATGQVRVLVSKAKIAGLGLNLQHCNWVAYFPTHSAESYYQAIRRCWRFGQKNPVDCHLVTTEAEKLVMENMIRKEELATEMYRGIIQSMTQFQLGKQHTNGQAGKRMKLPEWMKQ